MGRGGRPPGSSPLVPWPPLLLGVAMLLLCVATSRVDCMLNEDSSSSSDGGRNEKCDTGPCWELYQQANSHLGVRDNYDRSSSQRDSTPSPQDLVHSCTAKRTFYQCIQNMTLACRGDLNFHGVQRVIQQDMKRFNCSSKGRVFVPEQVPVAPPHQPRHPVCSYSGTSQRSVCTMFGDPHLRTFSRDFMTCRVSGAWSLLDNDYLTIQVTSDSVKGVLDTPATALSKVTLIIKSHEDCGLENHYMTYQAPDPQGGLPAHFDDGRTHFGQQKSVQVEEMEPNKHVEIYLRYVDTRVVIRRYGQYLALAVSVPEDLVKETRTKYEDSTMQLCLRGCPASQQLHLSDVLTHKHKRLKTGSPAYSSLDSGGATPTPQGQVALPPSGQSSTRTMSREAAQERCRNARVVDGYWDSCVFDLMSTGDSNFTRVAYNAMLDTLRLAPNEIDFLKNRTAVLDEPPKSGAASWQRGGSSNTNLHYLHRTMYILMHATLTYVCVALLQNGGLPSVIL